MNVNEVNKKQKADKKDEEMKGMMAVELRKKYNEEEEI